MFPCERIIGLKCLTRGGERTPGCFDFSTQNLCSNHFLIETGGKKNDKTKQTKNADPVNVKMKKIKSLLIIIITHTLQTYLNGMVKYIARIGTITLDIVLLFQIREEGTWEHSIELIEQSIQRYL